MTGTEVPAAERAVEAVRTASRSLSRLLDTDPTAVDVLDQLDERAPVESSSVDALVRWKRHEFLRIAARDLVGIDFQPANDFPADDTGYGFDNIADLLSVSPLLMEKYLHAAQQIVF